MHLDKPTISCEDFSRMFGENKELLRIFGAPRTAATWAAYLDSIKSPKPTSKD